MPSYALVADSKQISAAISSIEAMLVPPITTHRSASIVLDDAPGEFSNLKSRLQYRAVSVVGMARAALLLGAMPAPALLAETLDRLEQLRASSDPEAMIYVELAKRTQILIGLINEAFESGGLTAE